MLWKLLTKNGWFTIGVLMMVVVAAGSQGLIPGFFKNPKLVPTSCRAVLVKLEKRMPGNWKLECQDNNLEVTINELEVSKDEKELRPAMYRQLANHMVNLAKTSTVDILEKVFIVRFHLIHPKLEINAITEGKYIAKLATIESSQFVMDHLKQTVQVKETVK